MALAEPGRGREPGGAPTPDGDPVLRMMRAARDAGVELDEAEARNWLEAVSIREVGQTLVTDERLGVFGHRLSMLDFEADPDELTAIREIGVIVGLTDEPGVATALALSGSAAQGRIQANPGDCDFFERLHITAPTRAAACGTIARLIRDKVARTNAGPGYRLIEVKFGSYPEACLRGSGPVRAGSPISWTPDEALEGRAEGRRPDGSPLVVMWDAVAGDPGWCKLDWIVLHPLRRHLVNVSNMLDVTWEGPDGRIVPLDGFIDPYVQEVYLDAASLPIFSRLAGQLAPDAVERYVGQLEHEIRKYTTVDPNYGKAARRIYNVFRLTGRHAQALYIRELFDEPATALYRVWALLDTLDEAAAIRLDDAALSLADQCDALIDAARVALGHDPQVEVIVGLERFRDCLAGHATPSDRAVAVRRARTACIAASNAFFSARLLALPEVRLYLEGLAARD